MPPFFSLYLFSLVAIANGAKNITIIADLNAVPDFPPNGGSPIVHDPSTGNAFVCSKHAILRITPGILNPDIFAGQSSGGSPKDGVGSNAIFKFDPVIGNGLFLDGNTLIAGEAGTGARVGTPYLPIRSIDMLSATVTTLSLPNFLGPSYNDNGPKGLTSLPGSDTLFFSTSEESFDVRSLAMSSGVVTILAGNKNNAALDGIGTLAQFAPLTAIAVNSAGILFVAEFAASLTGSRIRAVTPSGVVSTFAGSGLLGFENGMGTAASFQSITSLAIDKASDFLFVADSQVGGVANKRAFVRAIAPNGLVTTFAGSADTGSDVLCSATSLCAPFKQLSGIHVSTTRDVYLVDEKHAKMISSVPAICPPGFWCDTITGYPCPVGTFNPLPGQGDISACILCPEGSYNPNRGSTSATACLPCSPGSANPYKGRMNCTLCADDTVATLPGSSTCTPCPADTHSSRVTNTCCPLGSWSVPGNSSCVRCPAMQYLPAPANSSFACAPCSGGTYSLEGSGACCAPGSYLPLGSSTCKDCGAGTYMAVLLGGSGDCTPCPRDTFSDATGATSNSTCKPCEVGLFSGTGASSCEKCPPGSFFKHGLVDNCTQCSPGYYSSFPGASQCTACPAGTFTPLSSSGFCFPCPVGSYCLPATGQPTPCPANTHSNTLAATSPSVCSPCEPGYFAPKGSAECLPDPTGATNCPPGTQPSLSLDASAPPCTPIVCQYPLVNSTTISSDSNATGLLLLLGCEGCSWGTFGAPGSCSNCTPGHLCPGLTPRPLFDFSSSLVSSTSSSSSVSASGSSWWDVGACPKLSPFSSQSLPPPTPTSSSSSSALPSHTVILLSLGGVLCAILVAFALGIWMRETCFNGLQRLFSKVDSFSLSHPVLEGGSPIKRSSAFGGVCSLLGYCFIFFYAINLLVQWRTANTLTQRSLDTLDEGVWRRASALPWASTQGLQGLILRLTLDGGDGVCSAPLLPPTVAGLRKGAWGLPTSTSDCSGGGVGDGGGGVSQLTFTCPACELGPDASLSLLFHYSCQSMLLEVGAIPALGGEGGGGGGGTGGATTSPTAATLFSAQASPPPGSLLQGVTWQVTPLLTLLVDTVGGGSQRGYSLTQASLATTLSYSSSPDDGRAGGGGGLSIVVPTAAAVNVTLLLPISPTYIITTLVEIVPLAQLLANIVGLGGLLSWFGLIFNALDWYRPPPNPLKDEKKNGGKEGQGGVGAEVEDWEGGACVPAVQSSKNTSDHTTLTADNPLRRVIRI